MNNSHNFTSLILEANKGVDKLPDMSELVRQDTKYTRPKVDIAKPILMTAEFRKEGIPVDFLPKPLLKLGRDNSRHEVHFGSLILDNQEASSKSSIEIAVKDCQLSSGLGEIAMCQYAASMGMYSFKPVGIFLREEIFYGDRLAHMVTIFDKEVIPLDALPWSDMDLDEAGLVIENAAFAAADFHKAGLFHGDLEFKNFGQRTSGEVAIVDLEHTVGANDVMTIAALQLGFSKETQDCAQSKIGRKVRIDLRSMKNSVCGLRPFASHTPGRKLRIARETILEPYMGRLETFEPTPPPQSAKKACSCSIHRF